MPSIPATDFKNIQTGLITESAVSEFRYPVDAVSESINFHFDKIGSATLRKGSTLLGDALSGNCTGLAQFRDSGSGTNNRIVRVNGTVLYYLSAGTWTSKRTGLTSGSKARFTTFLDFLWMVNSTEATAIWDGASGNSFVTTGNAASAPTGQFIENFRSRVWIAGNSTYPDRIYFSSVPSAVTTPIVTWNTSVTTGDWIDISPSDGENITGIKRAKKELLVFKQNHIYRVYSIAETEPDPSINVGTYSNESIVEAKDGYYFHHPSGFYRYSGGAVQEISKPIIDVVNGISLANYTKINGRKEDEDHIVWDVGTVSYGGVTYTNLSVRYTISTQTWTHYQYPSQFLFSSPYNDGSNLYQIVGDDNGKVFQINTGNTDNNSEIFYSLIHRWMTGDTFITTEKNLNKLLFSHKGGSGTKVQYQVENDQTNNWTKSLKTPLKQFDTGFDEMIKSNKIRFRLAGSSKGEPFEYKGFEIIKQQDKVVAY